MSEIKCPKCGHDLNPSASINTRDTKAIRETLLHDWFSSLKKNGVWKSRVKDNGNLRVRNARRELYVLEMQALGLPPEEDGMWDENYFKLKHWSNKPRSDFENWVEGELKRRPDRNLCGGRIEDFSIPTLMLESENTPEVAMDLIRELARDKKSIMKDVQRLQGIVTKLETKISELDTLKRHQAPSTIDEHYMDSIRTLRYNAGIDIDLSQKDLFGGAET